MPARYPATSAWRAASSSLPLQPTELPSLVFGPPWPHVPRLTVGTSSSVLPKRVVRMGAHYDGHPEDGAARRLSVGGWRLARGRAQQPTTDNRQPTTNA